MPRKPRNLIDGGYYHIITRGNDRKNIFRRSQDYKIFLKIIKNYLKKFQVVILHYCLMPNHIHLLIQVKKSSDLPKFMQGILQTYASYFRKKYKSEGFVFQNRYKSLRIEKESYLLDCARYIERNPLRAKLTDNLFNYPWSSFGFYAEGIDRGIITTFHPLSLKLANAEQDRRQFYQNYVLEDRPYDQIIDSAFKLK